MNAPSLARISTIISPRKFPPEADTIVIRILLEAVSDGLSSKGQFTNGAYTKVSEELLGAGYMYAASSVQRRFYKLKSMFEQLEKLLEAHPELRWDNDRNMVAASDRMWANVLKSRPEAASLRDQQFPLYHQLAELMVEINNVRLRRRSVSLSTRSSSVPTTADQSSSYSRDQYEGIDGSGRSEPEQPFTNLAPNDYTLSDVLTYTLDEKVKWRDVFASSPRLLHPPLCRDPRDHQLVWTNPPQSIYAIFSVLSDAAEAGSESWGSLVSDGIIYTLCSRALDLASFASTLAYLPSDLRERAVLSVPSPFHAPLQVLYQAVSRLRLTSSPTGVVLLNTIKAFWPRIMRRIWEEPFQTLKPIQLHVGERLVIARLFESLVAKDPTFLSCLDDHNNMSIPVLMRLWMHSTTSTDITVLAGVICGLINPHSPASLQYRAIHPMQRETFSLIALSFDNLHIEFFSTFVSRMLWLSTEELPGHMELLLHIHHVGRSGQDRVYAAFTNTASCFHILWSNSFSLLRLISRRGPLFDYNCHRISQAIIGNAAFCVHSVQGKIHQCQQLVEHWAISDFFGALDDILPIALYSSYFSVQLRNVLCGLVQIVRDYPDFVLPILSKEFPRCRTTHALTNWGKSDTTQPATPHGSLILMWTSLEKLCRTRCTSRCERRGCGNVAREQCSAVGCPTRYCSESCKQSDWTEHHLVCISTTRHDG